MKRRRLIKRNKKIEHSENARLKRKTSNNGNVKKVNYEMNQEYGKETNEVFKNM